MSNRHNGRIVSKTKDQCLHFKRVGPLSCGKYKNKELKSERKEWGVQEMMKQMNEAEKLANKWHKENSQITANTLPFFLCYQQLCVTREWEREEKTCFTEQLVQYFYRRLDSFAWHWCVYRLLAIVYRNL